MAEHRVLITPGMKVAELLDAYPELEARLIACAPAFKQLRNPALRRTVARVTSLAQAARVGGVSAIDLVNQLRQEVGQDQLGSVEENAHASTSGQSPPAWFSPAKISDTFDARSLIDAGEQPIGQVMIELKKIGEDQILEVITPFNPAPLIDMAREKGFSSFQTIVTAEEYHTYFSHH